MLNVKLMVSVLVAIAIGLIGIQAEAQTVDHQEGEAAVSGYVVDAATGEALSGVEVKVEDNGESAETNEEGEFSLDNLEPGSYTLIVEEEGYEEWSQTIEVTEDGMGAEVEISLQSSY